MWKKKFIRKFQLLKSTKMRPQRGIKDILLMGYYYSPKPYRRLFVCNIITGFIIVMVWIWINGGLFPAWLINLFVTPDPVTIKYLVDYFPETNQDGSRVKWSLDTNTLDSLNKAVDDLNVMMIEGSVILRGQGTSQQQLLPVMYTDIQDQEIAFEDWLSRVIASKKGFKIDFKTIEPVEICLQQLSKRKALVSGPVQLGADVLWGGVQDEGRVVFPPVDISRFLRLTSQFYPEATLVLGWALSADNHNRYSWEMVTEMHNLLRDRIGTQQFAISVQALLSRESIPPIKWLAERLQASVIVTSSPDDDVNPNDFLFLRNRLAAPLVYYEMRHGHAEAQETASELSANLQQLQSIRFRTEGWKILGSYPVVYPTSEAVVLQSGYIIYTEDPYVLTNEPMIVRGRVSMYGVPQESQGNLGFNIILHVDMKEAVSKSGIHCYFGYDGMIRISANNKGQSAVEELSTGQTSGCFSFQLMENVAYKVTLEVTYAFDCNTMSYFKSESSTTHSLTLDVRKVEFSATQKYIALSAANSAGFVAIDVFRIN